MQVSCLWQGDNLLTVSLSGHINYLNLEDPTTPLKIVKVTTEIMKAAQYIALLLFPHLSLFFAVFFCLGTQQANHSLGKGWFRGHYRQCIVRLKNM